MLYFSTGLRNKLAGMKAETKAIIIGADCTIVDGGGSADTITSAGNAFVTAGFAPGDYVTIKGATTPANDGKYTVVDVAAGTLTFATSTFNTGEAFAAGTALIACKGGSFKDLLKDGCIKFYTGSPPASADAAVTGSLLITFTLSSATFTPGGFANGLELGDAVAGVIAKAVAETWSGVGAINPSGIAGYFRWCANASDDGSSSTSLVRVQGTCGEGSSYDVDMSNSTVALSAPITIDKWELTFPASNL